jgi:hypothetical protein
MWASGIIIAFSCLIPVIAHEVDTPPSSRLLAPKLINIDKAEFGVFRVNRKNGRVTFIPTTRIPWREGDKYGWRIQLKNYKGRVTWREILQLPKAPESWGTQNTENFLISADGATAAVTRTVLAENGVIQNSWAIAAGDPPGKHRIDVYISQRRVASFEFEVVTVEK